VKVNVFSAVLFSPAADHMLQPILITNFNRTPAAHTIPKYAYFHPQ
jgi:hypothetical protein